MIGMREPDLKAHVLRITEHEFEHIEPVKEIDTVSYRFGVRFYICTDVYDPNDNSIITTTAMVPFVRMKGAVPFSVHRQIIDVRNEPSPGDRKIGDAAKMSQV
jgi:hypothetical protein